MKVFSHGMDPVEEEALAIEAIVRYAVERYGDDLKELTLEHWEGFPEKDWDIPEEALLNNFFRYLVFEVPFSKGLTIAEEYAKGAEDLDEGTRKAILGMRHMIRSRFVALSVKDSYLVQLKDMETGVKYDVLLPPKKHLIQPNVMVDGRIHPFGDHFRLMSNYIVYRTPMILDPDIFLNRYLDSRLEDLEEIEIKPRSRFSTIMNMYPATWIDSMCKVYGVKARLKKEKIARIEERIADRIPTMYREMPPKAKEVLRICLDDGGWVKMNKLKGFEDDTSYFWEERSRTPLGYLRQSGLLIIGKMRINQRSYSIAYVPKEFREHLRVSSPRTSLEDF